LDFLFIDGDHTYGGVRSDFEMYAPLVRKGGIVVFHDIVKHPPHLECDVDRFWREIRQRYRHVEIIKDPLQGWAGIGVLHV
jgi:predicted O-methyltransferase YrrM